MTKIKQHTTVLRGALPCVRWQWAVSGLLGLLIGAAPSILTHEWLEHPSARHLMPEVVFVDPEQLQPSNCPEGMTCLTSIALYEATKGRIYLRRGWSPDEFDDLGILLHEFVHHLQTIGKLRYDCPGAIELPAYALQEAFYTAHQRDPREHVPSPFTRFTRYSCAVLE